MDGKFYINGKEVTSPATKAVLFSIVLFCIALILLVLLIIFVPLGIAISAGAVAIGAGGLYLRHKVRKFLHRNTSRPKEKEEEIQEANVISSRRKDLKPPQELDQ